MAFVNEFATPEDLEKYGIKKLQDEKKIPGYDAWTIDRDRNIVLMEIGRGSKEGPDPTVRFMLKRGDDVSFHSLRYAIDNATKTIHWIRPLYGEIRYDSDEERTLWEARLVDLRNALCCHRSVGPYRSNANCYENMTFTNI